MYIILRLVCETFSRMAVILSFLWGHKHGVYAAVSLSANVTSWYSRNDTKNFTSVILYINIIFISLWLSSGNSEILHGSDVLHTVRNFGNKKTISSKQVSTFFTAKIWRHFSITSHLRWGPFLRGAAHYCLPYTFFYVLDARTRTF